MVQPRPGKGGGSVSCALLRARWRERGIAGEHRGALPQLAETIDNRESAAD
jgi:hypothetical protein